MVYPRRTLRHVFSNVHISWGMFLTMALFSFALTFQNLNDLNTVILTKLANSVTRFIDIYFISPLI